MKIFNYKIKEIKENNGYAILFTIVVVGIISMITMGLTNAVFKATVLASVAKDSTAAFYPADLASECALMFDNEKDVGERLLTDGSTGIFKCADKTLAYQITPIASPVGYSVILRPEGETDIKDSTSPDKCIRMDITINESGPIVITKVDARGYNICNKNVLRTVERSLQITY